MAENEKIPLIVITGPTATGKTELAIQLAKELDGEVVSADSMQIYKYMDVGTAKPSKEERQGIPHHLMDFLEPSESFSVARYVELAGDAIQDIVSRGKRAIVAGGTGLYISSLIDGIAFTPIAEDQQLRGELYEQAQREGNQVLWQKLEQADPVLARGLHPNNLGRVVRALEVFMLTGIPMSEHQRRSRLEPSPYNPVMLALCWRQRETLNQRINQRVDQMAEQGLAEEVKSLMQMGYGTTAFQAIGYKELFDYHRGLCSLEEALEAVKLGSRRYAKRQMTWLRRDSRVQWLFREDYKSSQQLFDAAMEAITPALPGR
ncbi:tRNA (adenosine(37)-N6)-dimethylallyltransferase MiaA [Oscillospiraceae bacterium MB08-C2-2]|nr:tRNA (adenosine(37)-N6)-dimethylallyltransferase MiaA [Oscillospiraceae bacterium MB08-C2-2]